MLTEVGLVLTNVESDTWLVQLYVVTSETENQHIGTDD